MSTDAVYVDGLEHIEAIGWMTLKAAQMHWNHHHIVLPMLSDGLLYFRLRIEALVDVLRDDDDAGGARGERCGNRLVPTVAGANARAVEKDIEPLCGQRGVQLLDPRFIEAAMNNEYIVVLG